MNPQPQSILMKNPLILCFLLAAIFGVRAQEQVSLEDAQKGARFLTQSAGKIGDAPFQISGDETGGVDARTSGADGSGIDFLVPVVIPTDRVQINRPQVRDLRIAWATLTQK